MSDSLSQLAAVLGMMGSKHDGEVLNAARHAERLRGKMDKTWGQLLASPQVTSDANATARAMRAELRVLELLGRVATLEKQIAELKAEPPKATRKRSAADTFTAPPGFDAWVVRYATRPLGVRRRAICAQAGVNRQWKPYLERLAAKNGYHLSMRKIGKHTWFQMS